MRSLLRSSWIRDFAASERVRRRWIAILGLGAAVALIAGAVLASSLAGASTRRPAPASAYGLALRIFSGKFVGSGSSNPIAVDHHGNVYVFRATRTQQGSIPSPDLADVEELSSGGHEIRSFPTTFHRGGHALYISVGGLAVTPNGRYVFVVGNFSEDRHVLDDSKPFLAKSLGVYRRVRGGLQLRQR
jgi:hypothetical protein